MSVPPGRHAVALEYDGSGAPRVTAKGEGEIARAIVELAREHGVPVQENGALLELLARVPLGEEIPEALYVAVAELLAFVYLLAAEADEPDQRAGAPPAG